MGDEGACRLGPDFDSPTMLRKLRPNLRQNPIRPRPELKLLQFTKVLLVNSAVIVFGEGDIAECTSVPLVDGTLDLWRGRD